MTEEPIATAATSFQVGLLCPGCQAAVAGGEAIITCPQCVTTHHATCWTRANRCSSYHCDPRTRSTTAGPAEIVITADETSRAVLAPKRVPGNTAEIAARAMQESKPTRWSVGAFVLLGTGLFLNVAAASGLFLAGKLSNAVGLGLVGELAFAFVFALASAIVASNLRRSRTHRGGAIALLALLSTLPAAAMIVGTMIRLEMGSPHSVPFDVAAPEPPTPESFENAPRPISNAMRANVFIQGHQITGTRWCGSGVILGQTGGRVFLLTNKHVTDPSGSGTSGELSVTFANGEIAGGKVEWAAPDGVDLAVVSAAATRPPRVVTRIRRSMLTVGEKTFGIGNPYSLAWTYTEGVCSRVYSKHTNVGGTLELVQTQTPIHPGNSGGGLYDGQGRLVGINTWVIESEGGPGFAISAKSILDVVEKRYLDLTAEDSNEKGEGE
jgi:S1-C subfamily serine protease